MTKEGVAEIASGERDAPAYRRASVSDGRQLGGVVVRAIHVVET
jgi:hypothetical protein